jgi:hypothetical protein
MKATTSWITDSSVISYVYENTVQSSDLRKIIVNEHVRRFLHHTLGEDYLDRWSDGISCDSEFNHDVVKVVREHLMVGTTP